MSEWWIKMTVATNHLMSDTVSEVLQEIGVGGVEISDPKDLDFLKDHHHDWADASRKELFNSDEVLVSTYIAEDDFTAAFKEKLVNKLNLVTQFFNAPASDIEVSYTKLKDEDWVNEWKAYYQPVRISHFLTIVPEWIDYNKESVEEKLIYLDPGVLFGTGAHATTRLALLGLETYLRAGDIVVDVGAGSGILSIAAALFNAKKVYSYDIDPNAEHVILQNARKNQNHDRIHDRIHVETANLLSHYHGKASVIVANILTPILMTMAEDAYNKLINNGILILSGILKKQRKDIEDRYVNAGFTLVDYREDQDWCSLVFKKVI